MSLLAHAAFWRTRDGERVYAVFAPEEEDFLAEVCQLSPRYCRFLADVRLWLFDERIWSHARELVLKHYPDQVCYCVGSTDSGDLCETWVAIHHNGLVLGQGGLDDVYTFYPFTDSEPAAEPEPPPKKARQRRPRPPKPPRPPRQKRARRAPPPPPYLPHERAARVLGVTVNASTKEIRAAAKRLALDHHPDRGGDVDKMTEVLAARDLLLGRRSW